VEVRRRTRPMVLFTNMQSVEPILYAIFYRGDISWLSLPCRIRGPDPKCLTRRVPRLMAFAGTDS